MHGASEWSKEYVRKRSVGKADGKLQFRRPRHRGKNNIKVYIKDRRIEVASVKFRGHEHSDYVRTDNGNLLTDKITVNSWRTPSAMKIFGYLSLLLFFLLSFFPFLSLTFFFTFIISQQLVKNKSIKLQATHNSELPIDVKEFFFFLKTEVLQQECLIYFSYCTLFQMILSSNL